MWQPLKLLGALAAWTDRVLLGASVLVAGNHWPVPLAWTTSWRFCKPAGHQTRLPIVECNFWEELDSPEAWTEVPDRLASLLN